MASVVPLHINANNTIQEQREWTLTCRHQEHILHVRFLEGFSHKARTARQCRRARCAFFVRVGTTPLPEPTRQARERPADAVAPTTLRGLAAGERGAVARWVWLCSRGRVLRVHPHEAKLKRSGSANRSVVLDEVRNSLLASFHVPVNVHEVLVQRIRDPGWRHRVQICDTMRGTTHQTRTG